MKKLLFCFLLFMTVTSFTKPVQEEKRKEICYDVGDCRACYITYTLQQIPPRGPAITVWYVTASCSGNAPVVISEGWYKEIE